MGEPYLPRLFEFSTLTFRACAVHTMCGVRNALNRLNSRILCVCSSLLLLAFCTKAAGPSVVTIPESTRGHWLEWSGILEVAASEEDISESSKILTIAR